MYIKASTVHNWEKERKKKESGKIILNNFELPKLYSHFVLNFLITIKCFSY